MKQSDVSSFHQAPARKWVESPVKLSEVHFELSSYTKQTLAKPRAQDRDPELPQSRFCSCSCSRLCRNCNFLGKALHSTGCSEGGELRWSLVLLVVWNRALALPPAFFIGETFVSALFWPQCITRTLCLAGWTHWPGSSHLQKGLTWGQARAAGIWTSSLHHDSPLPCGSLEVGSSENSCPLSGQGMSKY